VVKETKAQKAERLKGEKNPWESWDEVREFARLPVVGDLLAG
jgi:sulfite reductase (ferredoxin)